MRRSSVRCSSVECDAAQCNVAQCSAQSVQCGSVRCGSRQWSGMRLSQCDAAHCDAAQCGAAQCDAAQCNVGPSSFNTCSVLVYRSVKVYAYKVTSIAIRYILLYIYYLTNDTRRQTLRSPYDTRSPYVRHTQPVQHTQPECPTHPRPRSQPVRHTWAAHARVRRKALFIYSYSLTVFALPTSSSMAPSNPYMYYIFK